MKYTTYHTETTPNGIPFGVPNQIVSYDTNFYISHNNYDNRIYGCDTTALVVTGKGSRFFILDGDHSEQLKNKSFKDCLCYFHGNKRLLNKLSEDLPPLGSSVQDVINSPDQAMEILNRLNKNKQ